MHAECCARTLCQQHRFFRAAATEHQQRKAARRRAVLNRMWSLRRMVAPQRTAPRMVAPQRMAPRVVTQPRVTPRVVRQPGTTPSSRSGWLWSQAGIAHRHRASSRHAAREPSPRRACAGTGARRRPHCHSRPESTRHGATDTASAVAVGLWRTFVGLGLAGAIAIGSSPNSILRLHFRVAVSPSAINRSVLSSASSPSPTVPPR